MKMYSYLRIGDDDLNKAERCNSIRQACNRFRFVAEELANYGQAIDATIHRAEKRNECVEYPDYVLSLGPRGGVKCEKS
jgi:hypothetical protein